MTKQIQFKETLARNNLLIKNSKYYSYGIINPLELSQLNFVEVIVDNT